MSYEATRYGQGVLTYSLLLGMRGGALTDDRVEVGRLFDFAADRVPELARDIGGVQRPVVAVPRGGQSFPLGLVTKADQSRIPLQPARPLFLRTNLVEADDFADVLGLSKRVDEVLRSGGGRGPAGGVLFVDATDLPEGFRIAGPYRVAGDDIAVTANVLRGTARVGQSAGRQQGEAGRVGREAARGGAEGGRGGRQEVTTGGFGSCAESDCSRW